MNGDCYLTNDVDNCVTNASLSSYVDSCSYCKCFLNNVGYINFENILISCMTMNKYRTYIILHFYPYTIKVQRLYNEAYPQEQDKAVLINFHMNNMFDNALESTCISFLVLDITRLSIQ